MPDSRGDDADFGLSRVLITTYIILAIAATARSLYQIIAKYDEAPLAYALSAVSGAVYIVAVIALIKCAREKSGPWHVVAWITISFELVGVLAVGTLSIVLPEWFNHPSVWSWYGNGYLFVPLALPILGLLWLAKRDEDPEPEPEIEGSVY